jgi:gamma-glutamyl-gamma-aminobutyrate hydrolase PuuD
MTKKKVIGISMRVITDDNAAENRDALAQNWYPFLKWLLGNDADWQLLPNLGMHGIHEYLTIHPIDGVILTGGNDIGDCIVRDQTETALIEHALEKHLPIIGICRGLQMLWTFFGGRLNKVNAQEHIARRHFLSLSRSIPVVAKFPAKVEVNSYHSFGLETESRPETLIPFAVTTDQQIEGVINHDKRLLGLMWHPERENIYSDMDRQLIRNILFREKQ